MSDRRANLSPPPAILTLTEGVRASAEFVSLALFDWLLQRAPRGDGRAVLVIPGFMADDRSTEVLRHFLTKIGYAPYGWGLGANKGPASFDFEAEFEQLLDSILSTHGAQVSIIGQSLGGVYAREVAKAYPEKVRQVITLGSPLRGPGGSAKHVKQMFLEVSGATAPETFDLNIETSKNPPVPCSSIYSEHDGVVSWQASVQDDCGQAENIPVFASHLGMGVNPTVLFVIADRLVQSMSEWAPFEPPADLYGLFPA